MTVSELKNKHSSVYYFVVSFASLEMCKEKNHLEKSAIEI